MATAILREETTSSWKRPERPTLVLEDCTSEQRPSPARPRTRHLVKNRWENWLFAAAAATVLLFFLVSFAFSLYRSAAASYQSPLTAAIVVPVKVHTGDTLWTYAKQYGAPDIYILDRVETIARTNHLSSDASLTPGQCLLVPVTNPVKLAQIERSRRLAHR